MNYYTTMLYGMANHMCESYDVELVLSQVIFFADDFLTAYAFFLNF